MALIQLFETFNFIYSLIEIYQNNKIRIQTIYRAIMKELRKENKSIEAKRKLESELLPKTKKIKLNGNCPNHHTHHTNP